MAKTLLNRVLKLEEILKDSLAGEKADFAVILERAAPGDPPLEEGCVRIRLKDGQDVDLLSEEVDAWLAENVDGPAIKIMHTILK